jgi:hypothetical protein
MPPQTPSERPSSSRRKLAPINLAHVMAIGTGALAVAGIFVLVGLERLPPAEGLPWIAATLSGLAHLRQNGNGRWRKN